jgi:hypothetical protein
MYYNLLDNEQNIFGKVFVEKEITTITAPEVLAENSFKQDLLDVDGNILTTCYLDKEVASVQLETE